MRIPLNVIQYYIGLPLLIFVSARSFISNSRSPNRVTFLTGVATALFAGTYFCQGWLLLFSQDQVILNLSTALSVAFEVAGLFCIWLIVFRMYAPTNPTFRRIGASIIAIVAGVAAYIGVSAAFSEPTRLLMQDGAWHLDIPYPLGLRVLYAFLYFGLALIGMKFYKQGRQVKTGSQKALLYLFALGLFIFSGFFLVQPFMGPDIFAGSQGIYLLLAACLIGGGVIVNYLWRKRDA